VVDVGRTRGAAFHPTERLLAVAGAATVHLVDLDRGEVVRAVPNAHAGEAIYAIAFSADGQALASISEQGSSSSGAGRRSRFDPRWRCRAGSSPWRRSRSRSAVTERAPPRTASSAGCTWWTRQRAREDRTFANTAEAPGHGMHAELRYSLAFTDDGDWLFAPDTHDRGLRILHVPSGTTHPVLRGDGPFYKAVALALPASMVRLLEAGRRPGPRPLRSGGVAPDLRGEAALSGGARHGPGILHTSTA
jgi:WD40 repeat protein